MSDKLGWRPEHIYTTSSGVNDKQVNPLKLALPTSMPLEGLERGRYLNSSMALRTQLERAGEMILAAVE
jgi:hypothetical protein